ncbi:MAG: hypothetical protein JNM01_19695 [Delftia acidovorans]|nr:hypothetical protein [Delftia acidovorans]
MMQEWLRTLDDDAIADWASKGLLKRGAKALAAVDAGQWELAASQARAGIEGHVQTLAGAGFATLQCSCPAFGPCHHLCALLLGLRARLAHETPADGMAQAPAAPWLDGDAGAVAQAFGMGAQRKALRWMAQGFEAVLEEAPATLIGELSNPDEVTVRLPRAGGLAAASCSCKAAACAHRALVALQARRLAGAPVPQLPAHALEAGALQRLAQARQWLTGWVLQGRAGMSPAFLDQGEALATELRQADLPRPASVLNLLVRALRDERAGRAGAAERVAPLLAALWMLLRGLAQQPMPRPLSELAGVHRRSYRRVQGLCLHAVAAELWHARGGQRGFSVHLQDAASGRYLTWSASRAEGFDPEWEPARALDSETLGGLTARQLLQGPHVLLDGWASDDGRLSARDATRLAPAQATGPLPIQATGPLPGADDPQALLQRHLQDLHADPWRQQPPLWARLQVAGSGLAQRDELLQRWTIALQSPAPGPSLSLVGDLHGMQGRAGDALRRELARGRVLREVFGRVAIAAGQLQIAVASVRWQDSAHWHHPSTAWPAPLAEVGVEKTP